jgi:hypothetical protein
VAAVTTEAKHYLSTRWFNATADVGKSSSGVTQTKFVEPRRERGLGFFTSAHSHSYIGNHVGLFLDSDKGRFICCFDRSQVTHEASSMLQRLRRSPLHTLTVFGEMRPPSGSSQAFETPSDSRTIPKWGVAVSVVENLLDRSLHLELMVWVSALEMLGRILRRKTSINSETAITLAVNTLQTVRRFS